MPARHLLLNLAELLKLDKGARDQEKKTLVWLVRKMCSTSSGVKSSVGLMMVVPWQGTSTSMGPKSAATVSARRARSAMSVTSAT